MNRSLSVTTTRWSGGWELELDDDNSWVTHLERSRRLNAAC